MEAPGHVPSVSSPKSGTGGSPPQCQLTVEDVFWDVN